MTHPATKYANDVLLDKILSCRWVHLAAERHLNDLKHGHERGLYFDEAAADHVLEFFSHLRLWKGRDYKGKEFVLGPHYQFIASVIMGWKRADGLRRFRTAYVEEGRKSAKSTFSGGIGAYFLVADGEQGAEVYAAAALDLQTNIPTPSGWTTVRDIKVGDILFDDKGKQCNVTYITNVFKDHKCYELTFDNGGKIIADSGHLWETTVYYTGAGNASSIKKPKLRGESGRKAVFSLHNKKYYVCPWKDIDRDKKFEKKLNKLLEKCPLRQGNKKGVRTTKEIYDTCKYISKNNLRSNHSIKVAESIDCKEYDLPIDPYTLGIWLGDGRSNRGHICMSPLDIEIKENIENRGYVLSQMKGDQVFYFTILGVRAQLRLNNLLDNKHIPQIYLRASFEQRLELLKGLMDSDGTCTKTGECRFSNKNEKLITGVLELSASLGIKAHLRSYMFDGEKYYNLSFKAYNDFPVFNLKRKRERQIQKPKVQGEKVKKHYIVDVKEINPVPVKCISVDSQSSLFLAGSSMIPTHNTKKEQAKIVWTNIRNLTKKSIFSKLINYYVNNLSIESTWSKCEPLSSDTKSMDGLDTHFASLDELHAHPTPEVYDLIADSVGSRSQPLIFIITTAGFDQSGVCFQRRDYLAKILKGVFEDDSFFGIIFTLDVKNDWPELLTHQEKITGKEGVEEDDWLNEDLWIKPMPGLCGITKNGIRYGIDENGDQIAGYMTRIDDVRDKCKVAKEIVASQNNFLTKRLNIWTSQYSRWIDLVLWDGNNTKDIYVLE